MRSAVSRMMWFETIVLEVSQNQCGRGCWLNLILLQLFVIKFVRIWMSKKVHVKILQSGEICKTDDHRQIH